MNIFLKMLRAYQAGIKHPYGAWQASRASGLPFYVLCAFLERESSGGDNVFGHDPTIFVGAGRVTKKKYLEYRALRDITGKAQGVGPMQLTYPPYQDQADERGGCWNALVNMTVGAEIVLNFWNAHRDWAKAATMYNAGSLRNGINDYGRAVAERIEHWRKVINP